MSRSEVSSHGGWWRNPPWIAVALVVAVAVAIGAVVLLSGSSRPGRAAATSSDRPQHLVVIVMENKSYWEIVGNPHARYINGQMIKRGKLFTGYYPAFHPSLPNYLALSAADVQGCLVDDCPTDSLAGENLFHQLDVVRPYLRAAWKVYVENMPANCSTADAGQYAVRHNPALYFRNLDSSSGDGSCRRNDVPFAELAGDLAAHTLPPFAMIAPNLYDDMHSDHHASPCALHDVLQDEICQGDTWLSAQLPALLSDGGLNDVTVLLLWDEGLSDKGGGGHAPVIELGPSVPTASRSSTFFSPFGLENAFADWLGVPKLHPAAPSL